MYYAEMMIEGILHFRYDPKGHWRPATANMLNRRLAEMEKRVKDLEKEVIRSYKQGRSDARADLLHEVVTKLDSVLGR